MEVFGIGLLEVLAILVVMVIIFGPNRLPEIARNFGRTIRDLRRYAREFRDEHLTDLEEVRNEYLDIRHEVVQENVNFRSELKHINEDVRDILIQTKADAQAIVDDTGVTIPPERDSETPTNSENFAKRNAKFSEANCAQFDF